MTSVAAGLFVAVKQLRESARRESARRRRRRRMDIHRILGEGNIAAEGTYSLVSALRELKGTDHHHHHHYLCIYVYLERLRKNKTVARHPGSTECE